MKFLADAAITPQNQEDSRAQPAQTNAPNTEVHNGVIASGAAASRAQPAGRTESNRATAAGPPSLGESLCAPERRGYVKRFSFPLGEASNGPQARLTTELQNPFLALTKWIGEVTPLAGEANHWATNEEKINAAAAAAAEMFRVAQRSLHGGRFVTDCNKQQAVKRDEEDIASLLAGRSFPELVQLWLVAWQDERALRADFEKKYDEAVTLAAENVELRARLECWRRDYPPLQEGLGRSIPRERYDFAKEMENLKSTERVEGDEDYNSPIATADRDE